MRTIKQIKREDGVGSLKALHIQAAEAKSERSLPAHSTILPDGSAFFVADIETNAKPPENPVFWNPYNKVVQDHRDGTIDMTATNRERQKRGLPVPWTPEMAMCEAGLN